MDFLFRRRLSVLLAAAGLCAVGVSPAFAVRPQVWTHASAADFQAGVSHGVVVTSQGQIRLSRALTVVMPPLAVLDAPGRGAEHAQGPATRPGGGAGEPSATGPATTQADEAPPALVLSLAQGADGAMYAGTGNSGQIVALRNGKSSVFAALPEEQPLVTALLVTRDGHLLAAGSGQSGQIYRYNLSDPGADPEPLLPDAVAKDLQYVWAMQFGPDGTLYAAGGPKARLIAVSPAGEAKVVMTSDEDNFVSLAVATGGAMKGSVYLGSNPNGRVYRYDPPGNGSAGRASVLYDAEESEITALALDGAGNVYAATGAALEATPEDTAATAPNPHQPAGYPGTTETERETSKGTDNAASGAVGGASEGRGTSVVPLQAEVQAEPPLPHPAVPVHSAASKPTMEQPTASNVSGAIGSGETNRIYRIDPAGFVTEVLHLPATIYAMNVAGGVGAGAGKLVLATGPDGLVYEYDLSRDDLTALARTESRDVSALLTLADGTTALGLSNPASVVTVSPGLAKSGTYTSPVLDAGAVAQLGQIRLDANVPPGTTLTVAVRSGLVAVAPSSSPSSSPASTATEGSTGSGPVVASGWTEYSAEVPAGPFVKIPVAPGRYYQYRLTFAPGGAGGVGGAGGGASASVSTVQVSYQVPNQPPQISALSMDDAAATAGVAGGGDAGTDSAESPTAHQRTVTWTAEDTNGDSLAYRLEYRRVPGLTEPDTDWIPLKDRIAETSYTFDTRQLPDGRYQLRLTASDGPDNAPGTEKSAVRLSPAFLIDNTPPTFAKYAFGRDAGKVAGGGAVVGPLVVVQFNVSDAAGTVAGCHYRLDGDDRWTTAEGDDRLFDGPSEDVTIRLPAARVADGEKHTLFLRAVDNRGNVRYQVVALPVYPRESVSGSGASGGS